MTAADAVNAWLRAHPGVAEEVRVLGDAQADVMAPLDQLAAPGEWHSQRLAAADHLWCGVRAAVAAALYEPDPPPVAAARVLAERVRAGRAHIRAASIHAATEVVWETAESLLFPDPADRARALAILAVLNCPDLTRHVDVVAALPPEVPR